MARLTKMPFGHLYNHFPKRCASEPEMAGSTDQMLLFRGHFLLVWFEFLMKNKADIHKAFILIITTQRS